MRRETDCDSIDSRIFEQAFALEPSQRPAFAASACSSPLEAARLISILEQIDRLGSFMEGGQPSPERAPALKPGTLLAQRFTILSFSGKGGMGEVYCAKDELLSVLRALKIGRGIDWTDADLLSRFKEEVRLACRITHPNVCRIYDIFSDHAAGKIPLFLTMEWLEGPTLAQHLKERGKLPPADCLQLLSGISEGLNAIHTAGIIHRDLKPGNIFLVPEDPGTVRTVITDFGLASDSALPNSQPQTGQLIGTPDYMAPEQFLGEPCTPATDVYALGLICFELLTGSKPNGGANVFQTAILRTSGRRALLSGNSSGLPVHWQAVLDRALASEPQRRFQSPRAFVAALVHRPFYQRLSRRQWFATAAGFSSIGIALFYAQSRYRGRGLVSADKQVIMLTATTCSEVDQGGCQSARIATRLLRAQLAQSAHISVLPADRVAAVWQRLQQHKEPPPLPQTLEPAAARDIALRSGASLLLFSSVHRIGGETRLTLEVERLDHSTTSPAYSESVDFSYVSDTQLPYKVDLAAQWLRAATGEPARDLDLHNRHSDELTTKNWEALVEYSRGDSAWTANRFDEAITLLESALKLDPNFAARVRASRRRFDGEQSGRRRIPSVWPRGQIAGGTQSH
jgi:hypothetical protein